MTRQDRICVAIAMQGDGFTARDIAQVASLRMETIVKIRRATGNAPGPKGWAAGGYDRHHGAHPKRTRSLELVCRALQPVSLDQLPLLCLRLRIGVMSGYGIRRAVDYSLAVQSKEDLAPMYRCVDCGHLTPTHPCAHCGASWLTDRDAA